MLPSGYFRERSYLELEATMDLVGTCPKSFWEKWIAEGDCAGDPATGEEYAWWTRSKMVFKLQPGDRFYVVALGKLRGWAPVVRIIQNGGGIYETEFGICRRGGAVACTIPEKIPGFRGLRKRWWEREQEVTFSDWRESH
jgi:hypothetical protein